MPPSHPRGVESRWELLFGSDFSVIAAAITRYAEISEQRLNRGYELDVGNRSGRRDRCIQQCHGVRSYSESDHRSAANADLTSTISR